KFSSDAVKDIVVKILPVLDYVHNQGIVHRDIKPDNIIIRDADNLPVLIDFGAVKETMQTIVAQSGSTPLASIMTGKSSIIIGTPGFMSSEQMSGRPVFSSDLYALGMTAIYLLTGKMPQELDSDPRTGEVIWKEDDSNVSPQLAAVLDKAIQSHLRDRFSSVNEMLEALQSETIATTVIAPRLPDVSPTNEPSTVVSDRENKTVSSNVEKTKGKKTPVILGLVGFLLLGGVGTFAFSMMDRQQAFQQRLAGIEAERQKAEELRKEQNENNTKREQELQSQLEEEKRLREEAEKRRTENIARQTDSNSNSNSNSNSDSSSNSFPEGKFTNNEWSLNLFARNNNIYYQAQSLKDSSSLNLENGRTSGSNERKIYTWNNGAYRYQVVWQPNDPDFVRLRVFTPSGELLNQLLSKS
ncbi:MAG: hypothetical protein WBA39_14490, partial [Rivularia sp. (in: cyanobacteria)]